MLYQWGAYNLRILDTWLNYVFIFNKRLCDLDHVTLIFSEKNENLVQFFEKWSKRGLNDNFLAKITIMERKYMKRI